MSHSFFSGIFLRVLYLTNMDSAKNSLRQCNSQIVTYTEGLFRENASMAIATNGVARLAYTNASTGERLFSQCKRLVDKDGNITGVISIDCSNENITRQLSAKYQYTSQRSFIMDTSGNVLIHPEDKYIDDSIRNYMDPRTWERIANGSSNYGEYKKSGVNAMAYFEQIPETTFIVATAIDAWEVTSPIVRSVMYLLMAVAALCIALGVILSRVMVYRCAEHWDGSGWPAGLAGRDIPLLSQAIAVVDAYFAAGCDLSEFEQHGAWYDPDIVAVLRDYVRCIRS